MIYQTHYDTLQVTRTASPEVIRAAYKSLSQRWHPDRNPDNRAEAEYRMKGINAAYAVLSNLGKRAAYDAELDAQTEAASHREPPPEPKSTPRQPSSSGTDDAGGKDDVWDDSVAGHRSSDAKRTNSPNTSSTSQLTAKPNGFLIVLGVVAFLFVGVILWGQLIQSVLPKIQPGFWDMWRKHGAWTGAVAIGLAYGFEEIKKRGLLRWKTSEEAPLSETPRPWIRFWARLLDMQLAAIITGSIFSFFALNPLPSKAENLMVALIALLGWVFAESLLLATIGTTPGKWLLKVRIAPSSSSQMNIYTAYSRSIKVWWRGLGMGLPLVWLITMAVAYRNISRNGITTWDRDERFTVLHGKVSVLRTLIVVALIAGCLFLALASTTAGQTKKQLTQAQAPQADPQPWKQNYQQTSYVWLTINNRVQVEVPSDWIITNQRADRLSVQSPVVPTNTLEISLTPLQPPLSEEQLRQEYQADPAKFIGEIAQSWGQSFPGIRATLAEKGLTQVQQATYAVELIAGRLSTVMRYGYAPVGHTDVMTQVELYQTPLGTEKATVTLTYLVADPSAVTANQRIKNNIVISENSSSSPMTKATPTPVSPPAVASRSPKFDRCYAKYQREVDAVPRDASLGEYANTVEKAQKRMNKCLR